MKMVTNGQILINLEEKIKNEKITLTYVLNNEKYPHGGALYWPEYNIIHVYKNSNIEHTDTLKLICTLAHELGHHYDYLEIKLKQQRHKIRHKAYIDFWNNQEKQHNMSKENKHEVYRREVAAWDHAAIILRNLDYTHWQFFFQYREKCLAGYLSAMGII